MIRDIQGFTAWSTKGRGPKVPKQRDIHHKGTVIPIYTNLYACITALDDKLKLIISEICKLQESVSFLPILKLWIKYMKHIQFIDLSWPDFHLKIPSARSIQTSDYKHRDSLTGLSAHNPLPQSTILHSSLIISTLAN